jgi:allophanate hydrolase subunit 2
MAVRVVKPGFSTTIQDLGRPGYYHLGIPISGAMDRYALKVANLLVGNNESDAALEAVFAGPELLFGEPGAELPPKVDNELRPTWTAFVVEKGQTLSFGFLKRGARAYIAVSGGIDVPTVLGSRSTTLGSLGGFEGRSLKADDLLKLGEATLRRRAGIEVRPELVAKLLPKPPSASCLDFIDTESLKRRPSIFSRMFGR